MKILHQDLIAITTVIFNVTNHILILYTTGFVVEFHLKIIYLKNILLDN